MVSEIDLFGFDEDLSFSDSGFIKVIVFPTPVPEVVPRPTLSRIKVKFGVKFDIFGGLNPSTEPKFSRLLMKNGSESVCTSCAVLKPLKTLILDPILSMLRTFTLSSSIL